MELKYQNTHQRNHHHSVLIVPLWNWNYVSLLKFRLQDSFNRTFMELKYESFKIGYNGLTVLIVPLWNWNGGGGSGDAD